MFQSCSNRSLLSTATSFLFLSLFIVPTHLLGRVFLAHFFVPVGGTAHAQCSGLARHVVTVPGRGNRVQAHAVRLAVLGIGAWGDHAKRLAFPVRDAALSVDHNVAGFAGGLRANDTLHRGNLAHVRRLFSRNTFKERERVARWEGEARSDGVMNMYELKFNLEPKTTQD